MNQPSQPCFFDDHTLWWEAIDTLNLPLMQDLLARGVNPNLSSPNGDALDRLVRQPPSDHERAAPMIEVLLKAGASPFRSMMDWATSTSGRSSRASVVSSSFKKALLPSTQGDLLARTIVEHFDWSALQHQDLSHQALMLAVQFQPQLVMPMVERGAPVNGDDERSVLAEAIHRGPVDLVSFLLDKGAGLSRHQTLAFQDEYLWVAWAGAREGEPLSSLHQRRLDTLDILSERWPMMPDSRAKIVGEAVINRCDIAFLHRLVDLGANPNGTTKKGLTALHFAVDSPTGYRYVKPLLAMGLNPLAATDAGQTVIDRLLHKSKNVEVVKPILSLLERHVLQGTVEVQPEKMPLDLVVSRARL